MSLLDFKMPGLDTAEGQGIMAAALSLLQAQKMPGQRGLAGALGGAGQQYMQTSGQARQQAMQSKLQGAQLAQYEAVAKKQQEEADREKQMRELYARYATPGQPGAAGALPPMQGAGYDYEGLASGMAALDPMKALQLKQSLIKQGPKFSTAPQYDQNGRAFVMAEDGTLKYLDGVKARDKLISEDLNGKKIYRTEYSPEELGSAEKTMSFSDKIAAANLDLSRKKFTYQKDQDAAPKASEKPMTPLQETKYRTQIAKDNQAANSVIQNMDDVIDSITAVKTSKGLDRATGLYAYSPSVPGSDAAEAEVRLQNLEGKITNLGKAAASASGAMGPMAVQEWKIVRDMVAAIDPKKGKKPLLEQLDLAENAAKGAAQRIRDGYEKHYGADFEKYPQFADLNPSKDRAPKPSSPSKAPMKGQVIDGYKFMGGDPAVQSNWVKQ